MIKRYEEYLKICKGVRAAMGSKADWEAIHDFVFSDEVSGRLKEMGLFPDSSIYQDPDCGHEDDVRALAKALFVKESEYKKIVFAVRPVERS